MQWSRAEPTRLLLPKRDSSSPVLELTHHAPLDMVPDTYSLRMLSHHSEAAAVAFRVQVVIVRSLLSLAVCLVAMLASGVRPLMGARKRYGILVLRGVFGAASQSLGYFCIDRLPLADAVTLIFLNP